MSLPFTYRRIQRQPLDERLPGGQSVDEAAQSYPGQIQSYDPNDGDINAGSPYDEQDPKPQTVPWRGGSVPPAAPVQQPPAIDPQIINEAFARPDTSTPLPQDLVPSGVETPKPTLPKEAPPVMISTDKYKRPDRAIGGETEQDRNQALLDSVRRYQPKNAHGWRRYMGPILQGWRLGQATNPRSPYAGLGGAIVGALTGQFRPKLDDERWQAEKEADVSGDIKSDLEQQKALAQVEDLQQRPILRDREQTRKEARDDMLRDQQEWSRRFAERKQDTYEDYVNWRKANGDRRADTAEGLAQLRKEYQTFQQQFQTRKQDNLERHEKVTERQAQKKIDLSQQKGPGVAQFRTRFNQARSAVNRFNDLTRRAAQAASWGDSMAAANSQALIQERDQLEQQIRDQYGDLISEDDRGKPSQLRKMWSVSQFKSSNPKADIKAAQERAESEGAIIIP